MFKKIICSIIVLLIICGCNKKEDTFIYIPILDKSDSVLFDEDHYDFSQDKEYNEKKMLAENYITYWFNRKADLLFELLSENMKKQVTIVSDKINKSDLFSIPHYGKLVSYEIDTELYGATIHFRYKTGGENFDDSFKIYFTHENDKLVIAAIPYFNDLEYIKCDTPLDVVTSLETAMINHDYLSLLSLYRYKKVDTFGYLYFDKLNITKIEVKEINENSGKAECFLNIICEEPGYSNFVVGSNEVRLDLELNGDNWKIISLYKKFDIE